MKTFELTPTNGRKSFYGKCKVEKFGKLSTLFSYSTKVATFDNNTNKIWVTQDEKHLTNTTLTHVRAFLNYYGFDKMTKKEILNASF